jgi:hypothetical protein
MSTQLALSFDAILVTCEVQQRYHSIAPYTTSRAGFHFEMKRFRLLTSNGSRSSISLLFIPRKFEAAAG